MARPLSIVKRKALLKAAATLIAEVGTSAATSKIASTAGVSEGAFFTYFPTKDDLLNELLLEIETDLAETMLEPYPPNTKARDQLYEIWNRLINWGLANPINRNVMQQLKISDRVTDETRRLCESLLSEPRAMVERCLAQHASPDRAGFFIDYVLFGLANLTVDRIFVDGRRKDEISDAAFDLFWKGSAA